MGFTIFTSSGTFSPSDYGLNTGDLIHIKCVGGGGGGGSDSYAGSAGEASSFGSILTAAGGNGGVAGTGSLPTAQEGSCRGLPGSQPKGMMWNNGWAPGQLSGIGGGGGAGWVPGKISYPICGAAYVPFIFSHGGALSTSILLGNQQTIPIALNLTTSESISQIAADNSPSNVPQGNYGGAYTSSKGSYGIGGAGGLGYGGGGGGCSRYASGGNGGVIADKDYVLPNRNSIAVTVGAGGQGGSSGSTYARGGGGAKGCVAVWW